jgi:hypothetical protein
MHNEDPLGVSVGSAEHAMFFSGTLHTIIPNEPLRTAKLNSSGACITGRVRWGKRCRGQLSRSVQGAGSCQNNGDEYTFF